MQNIIIISSPSGAGKTTICKRLLMDDKKLKISVSDTTRSARDNEINGEHYNFISQEEFKDKIRNNQYIEYANVFENFYGSLKSTVNEHLKNGYDVLFDIDWQGADKIKQSNYPNILSFFIVPPSKKITQERLMLRAQLSGDNHLAIKKRMEMYEIEMHHKNDYDHIILNDNLDLCISQIKDKIK